MTDTNNKKPAFIAYIVTGKSLNEDYWMRAGAAFAHKDEQGFNLVLNAVPVNNGRLVLRASKD